MLIQITSRSDILNFYQWELGFKMNSGCLSALIVMISGLFYTGMGFSGLENQFGILWAGAALTILIVFNFTLPLSIGAYFYTTNVLGWHWFCASLFMIILITIIVPALIKSVNSILNPTSFEK